MKLFRPFVGFVAAFAVNWGYEMPRCKSFAANIMNLRPTVMCHSNEGHDVLCRCVSWDWVAKCLACESDLLPSLTSFWLHWSVASFFVWTFLVCCLCVLFRSCCIWLWRLLALLNSCTCCCCHRLHRFLQFCSCSVEVQSLGKLGQLWVSWIDLLRRSLWGWWICGKPWRLSAIGGWICLW